MKVKMKYKYILFLYFLSIISPFSTLCADRVKENQIDKFIIAGWVGPHQTKKQYRLYKEAGFNTILDYYWEGDDYKKAFKLAKKAGDLNILVNIDQRLLRHNNIKGHNFSVKIENFINEIKEYNENKGYFLYDEPESNNIPMLIETIKIIQKGAPEKLIWINFAVEKNYTTARSLLDKFVPSIISTDYYPFENNKNRMNDYYHFLNWFRELSSDYNVPFWAFVQSSGFKDSGGDKRPPTPEEIRLQVYTNIAYGAKGIWYFTYVTPRHAKGITSAILDKHDNPTSTYETVKTINKEILSIAPLLVKLKTKEVVHVGKIHKGLKQFTPDRFISNVNGSNLIIGYFSDSDNINYIMVVNKQTDCKNNIGLTFGEAVNLIFLLNKMTGEENKVEAINRRYQFELQGGDGILLKLM